MINVDVVKLYEGDVSGCGPETEDLMAEFYGAFRWDSVDNFRKTASVHEKEFKNHMDVAFSGDQDLHRFHRKQAKEHEQITNSLNMYADKLEKALTLEKEFSESRSTVDLHKTIAAFEDLLQVAFDPGHKSSIKIKISELKSGFAETK
jgi:hypothetical protein